MVFGFRKRGNAPEDAIVHDPRGSDDKSTDKHDGITSAVDAGVAAEAARNLKHFKQFHQLDANLPIEELDAVDEALKVGDAEKEVAIERALLEDNSPYPEVSVPVRMRDHDVADISKGSCLGEKL
jgi:hypothetical protein